jgi:hypothetical protein
MDVGGAVIGTAVFLAMFVVAYFCQRRPPPRAEPRVVIPQTRYEPGDPEPPR